MLFFRYRSPVGAWSVDLGQAVRLGEVLGLTECAEHGSVGASTIVIDDSTGTAGHASDGILGLQVLEVDEGDEALGNRRVWTGYTGARTYQRGERHLVGAGRDISVELRDLNSILGDRIITGGSRASETASARIDWLLASGWCAVYDSGYVFDADLTVTMDATDYTGQTAGDVVSDVALAANVNHFVYWDEATQRASLWLGDSNYREDWSSTLRLSNVSTDWDSVTLGPTGDARLQRSSDRVVAGVYATYSDGAVYRTRPGTADTFHWRDANAPNSNITTAASATTVADNLLNDAAAEDDRLTVAYECEAAYVNDVRAGMRMQVRFSHLPGYESFRWCRVLRRSVAQDHPNETRYTVTLELSPQPALTYSIAYLMRPNDNDVFFPATVWWDHDGDNEQGGDSGPNQQGLLTYYPTPKPGTGWTGILVGGSGVVDLSAKFTGTEAFSGSGATVTANMQRNGVTVGSQTVVDGGSGAHVWNWTIDFDTSDVFVRRGDVLAVYCTSTVMTTSTVPTGVGAGDHHFSAEGYLAVRP